MVNNNGDEGKLDASPLLTNFSEHRKRQQSHNYVSDDIWLEILSRLPIKSLFITRCVSKLWRKLFFILYDKLNTDPLYVPLCGLLLASRTEELCSLSYICLKTKKSFRIPDNVNTIERNFIYSSGFERGLLSDLSFDLSLIHKYAHTRQVYFSTCLYGGLVFATYYDGTSEVNNPATKQIYNVSKSRTVAKYGFQRHCDLEVPGFIIHLPSPPYDQKCRFVVLRFCTQMGIVEVYCNMTHKWKKYRLEMDDELVKSLLWHLSVALNESGVLSVYVLTNKDCGIAIKFKRCKNSEMKHYSFPLPEAVVHGAYQNTGMRECENNGLYLSYSDATSLWIWKAGSTQADAWAWVPMLEISRTRLSCKPVAREHLSKVVRDASERVMLVACDHKVAVVYLVIKSSIFAYNLHTDTLDKIDDMKGHEDGREFSAYTFRPCFNFL